MKYSHKSKTTVWHILVLIFTICGLAVAVDQSPYPDSWYEWYRIQRLKHHMSCQGEAKWLSYAAIEGIKQPTLEPLTNISLAYLSPAGELSTCVSGWVNRLGEKPVVDVDTVYQFASVTKIFMSDIILDLIRTKKLNLDDKLVDLLPELHNKIYKDKRVADIEIQHLLSHTAGFDREVYGVKDNIFEPNPWCPNQVEQLTKIDLQFAPGERMAYSNTGYCLLSRVAEEKYNQSYRDVVREQYRLNRFKSFDFIGDAGEIPTINSAIKPLNEDLNYESLASSAGLYGNASALANIIYKMEKSNKPHILNRAIDTPCKFASARGCHGFMGYEYSTDPRLRFYWRDGGMNNVSTLLIIDDEGGVMSMLTNTRKRSIDVSQLVEIIYQYRLDNGL